MMDANNGRIWAKLDAGTEAYYQRVNRPNHPLAHVLENIIAAARDRPVVIQSLFMRLDGEGPGECEIAAFVERLKDITSAGGEIEHVQVYTVARKPAESFVTALPDYEVMLVHLDTADYLAFTRYDPANGAYWQELEEERREIAEVLLPPGEDTQ